jgi:hypothetical protein
MNTSELPVTETVVADTSTVDNDESGEACPTCGHPLRDHDALGTRFCAATATAGLSRGCICR